MPVCLACYGNRLAALLETATLLRFYLPGEAEPYRQTELPAPAQSGGLDALLGALRAERCGVLLCGGLACCSRQSLAAAGVRVAPWLGGAADEVALAWSTGDMQRFRLPGCGRKWRRCGRRNISKEREAMPDKIIAVTSEGPLLDYMVDPRFGRAAGFVVVNLATDQTSYVDNGGSQALAQGAGIQAAENVARAGAGAVLSGFVGPKAFQALAAAGIAVVQNVENMTVRQAVDKYRKGEFATADAPNAQAGGNKVGA
jgi:predicted Fe-Mo cluster-binding NifX family protein